MSEKKETKGMERKGPRVAGRTTSFIHSFPIKPPATSRAGGPHAEENFNKKGLIDYNIDCLKQSLQALYTPASRAASRAGGRDSASPDGVGAAGPSSSAESGDRSR